MLLPVVGTAQLQLAEVVVSDRFWPNGLFGNTTKKARMSTDLGGLNADSWCAVGLAMPEGTKLRFRLHVGPSLSRIENVRDVRASQGRNGGTPFEDPSPSEGFEWTSRHGWGVRFGVPLLWVSQVCGSHGRSTSTLLSTSQQALLSQALLTR